MKQNPKYIKPLNIPNLIIFKQYPKDVSNYLINFYQFYFEVNGSVSDFLELSNLGIIVKIISSNYKNYTNITNNINNANKELDKIDLDENIEELNKVLSPIATELKFIIIITLDNIFKSIQEKYNPNSNWILSQCFLAIQKSINFHPDLFTIINRHSLWCYDLNGNFIKNIELAIQEDFVMFINTSKNYIILDKYNSLIFYTFVENIKDKIKKILDNIKNELIYKYIGLIRNEEIMNIQKYVKIEECQIGEYI